VQSTSWFAFTEIHEQDVEFPSFPTRGKFNIWGCFAAVDRAHYVGMKYGEIKITMKRPRDAEIGYASVFVPGAKSGSGSKMTGLASCQICGIVTNEPAHLPLLLVVMILISDCIIQCIEIQQID